MTEPDRATIKQMISSAREAMNHAHAPISSFPVGAALLTTDGNIYPGCNTESVIAGLGTCAERSAVDHAVIYGETSFSAILVASQRPEPLYPCGACRQYLYEFSQRTGRDIIVYALGANEHLESVKLSRLLPNGFGPLDKKRPAGLDPGD